MKKRLITLVSALSAGLALTAAAQPLLMDPDLSEGLGEWTVRYDQLAENGAYLATVTPAAPSDVAMAPTTPDGSFTLMLPADTGAPVVRSMVYKDIPVADLATGDVVHFSFMVAPTLGTEELAEFSGYILGYAANGGALTSIWDAAGGVIASETEPGMMMVEVTVPDLSTSTLSFLRVGFSLVGPSDGETTVVLSDLNVWLNDNDGTWGPYPSDETGYVDTFIGWIYPVASDWVWSYQLNSWVYLPESAVEVDSEDNVTGSWMYVLATPEPEPEPEPEPTPAG